MPFVSPQGRPAPGTVGRPIVAGLFVASCLLSIVSWYTTQQGMALYLSNWFSMLASLGIQTALVLVAWLIGFSKAKRGPLIAVYVMTAAVSIAFSYVSLYTWFSARERPATVQRKLYDELTASSAQAIERLSSAIAEGQKHVIALDEMTVTERAHGFISRAQDADPYLAAIREAVAAEARTYSRDGVLGYKEGAGEGLRYTAFERYAKLARQSLTQLQQSHGALAEFRSRLKPTDPTDRQLREFHQVYDGIPWSEAERHLHAGKLERPATPEYSQFVDRTSGGQEDLMLAFEGLIMEPTGKHAFALALATFIDVIIFLLAFASGPYFFGAAEQRWTAAAAAMESTDQQIFVRNLLRKLRPDSQGMARIDASNLSPGEQQFCLLLAAKGQAVLQDEDGRLFYVLEQSVHESLMESLAVQGLPLRAAAEQASAQA